MGYKEYSFTDVYQNLLARLEKLNYEIYLSILYLKNTELYLERLKRDVHHNYQSFSVQNSIAQQLKYLQLGEELKDSSINIQKLAMDDFSSAYKEINKVYKIGAKTTITKNQIGG